MTAPGPSTENMLLQLRLIKAKDLAAKDKTGKSDPFIKWTLDGKKKTKSKIIKQNLNPEWNETYYWEGCTERTVVRGEMWDHDLVGKDFMGFFQIEAADMMVAVMEPVEKWIPLQKRTPSDKVTGEVLINVQFREKPNANFDMNAAKALTADVKSHGGAAGVTAPLAPSAPSDGSSGIPSTGPPPPVPFAGPSAPATSPSAPVTGPPPPLPPMPHHPPAAAGSAPPPPPPVPTSVHTQAPPLPPMTSHMQMPPPHAPVPPTQPQMPKAPLVPPPFAGTGGPPPLPPTPTAPVSHAPPALPHTAPPSHPPVQSAVPPTARTLPIPSQRPLPAPPADTSTHHAEPHLPPPAMATPMPPVSMTPPTDTPPVPRAKQPPPVPPHHQLPPTPSEPTATATFDYQAANDTELSLTVGNTYTIAKEEDGWYQGTDLASGKFGWFPGNYVEKKA